jgi:putative transposase
VAFRTSSSGKGEPILGVARSLFLRTLYVLFFIEVGTWRVRIARLTANPDAGWVTQQARNLAMNGEADNVQFLIRGRDSEFTTSFDESSAQKALG